MKKGDFFRLFWDAWVSTFTEKLILSAFKHTGLIPFNPNVILDKFAAKEAEPPKTPPRVSRVNSGKDWRTVDRHLQACVKDKYSSDAVVVRDTLHHLSIQNQLLEMENLRLQEALNQQKKGNKRGRALPLIQRQKWEAETQWWSSSLVNKAQQLLDEADEAEKAEEIRKADAAELRETTRRLKQKLEAEKKERDERKAGERKAIDERKAQRQRQKEEKDRKKTLQLSQKGKRTASQAAAPRKKQKRSTVGVQSSSAAHKELPAAPTKHNTRGRKITLPKRYV
ncbi:hypothetical protein EJ07DRAFT_136570 [Lizonia empirigonia]|nr:hypothetical protein EJ07DRAFT_136570 [Lizonia empirigonia]